MVVGRCHDGSTGDMYGYLEFVGASGAKESSVRLDPTTNSEGFIDPETSHGAIDFFLF